MTEPSKTPRTDAEVFTTGDAPGEDVVNHTFARSLELALTAAESALAAARAECERWVDLSKRALIDRDAARAEADTLREAAGRWRKVESLAQSRWDGTLGRPPTWWLRINEHGDTFGEAIDRIDAAMRGEG